MSRDGSVAQCYFLDVGQGTSQVILLGDGRAVVIDGGPDADARVPLRLLTRHVRSLAALVVSHNDADHARGALPILNHFRFSLDRLCFLFDRPGEDVGLFAHAGRSTTSGRGGARPDQQGAAEAEGTSPGPSSGTTPGASCWTSCTRTLRPTSAGRRTRTAPAACSG
ncbi:MAG: MBL fold metallo-hydrolase [Isosphaeraceae bacterium]